MFLGKFSGMKNPHHKISNNNAPSIRSCLVLITLVLALKGQPTLAGDWEFFPNADYWAGECTAQFTGPIYRGDLTQAYTTRQLSNFERFCLNSQGGNLMEVYEFLELFSNASSENDDPFVFSTRVRSGDECLSACAILFMFGQSFGANSPYPDRVLERGARLGFHSPFIDPAAAVGVDSASAFAGAVSIANLLAANTYRQVTTEGPVFPQELLGIILSTPPDDMYFVRHLAEFFILGISTDGDEPPRVTMSFHRSSVEAAISQICGTSHVVSNRNWFVTDGYDFSELIQFSHEYGAINENKMLHLIHRTENRMGYAPDTVTGVLTGPYFVPGWFSAGAQLYCMVDLRGEVDGDAFIVSEYTVNFGFMNTYTGGIPDAKDGWTVPSLGLLPIDTLYE